MNDNPLAWAIVGAMVLIVLTGLVLGLVLGRAATNSLGWSGAKKYSVMLGLGALGVGCGMLVMIATFFESTWAPPPQVTFNAPPGFAEKWVIMLEDPAVSTQLNWQGRELPFSGKRTSIDVPLSGIVRVKSFGALGGRVDTTVKWSDGSTSTGQGGGPAPKSTGAVSYSAFNRAKAGDSGDTGQADPPFGDADALGAYIAARERGAR